MKLYNKMAVADYGQCAFALLSYLFILVIYGAVPFLSLPTLSQTIWLTGFSESFTNGSLLNLYANNMGAPQPAAIAFGLSGAYPVSILLRIGLHPADAYSFVASAWLGLAMYSTYKIARRFGSSTYISILASIVWLSMPIIWQHANYSMLSIGFALIPFYFLAALKLFSIYTEAKDVQKKDILFYFGVSIIAVFMDGYTFMMFACGASLLLFGTYINYPHLRLTLIKIGLPVHFLSFGGAYLLYNAYVGESIVTDYPIDFFRGWGLDIAYIFSPSQQLHWLADLLDIGVDRNQKFHFGDPSVWTTTYAAPILSIGVFAWIMTRKATNISSIFLLIAIFSFYMALGPSLKINSTRPQTLLESQAPRLLPSMPAEDAVMPTGSAWISENLPGFKLMRASYRWFGLTVFALWMLTIIFAGRSSDKYPLRWSLLLIALILFNLPHLGARLEQSKYYRSSLIEIDKSLVVDLTTFIHPNELVIFLPWDNDFLANYLASRGDFQTYNVGGDKNLRTATAHWPKSLLGLRKKISLERALASISLLESGEADAIVLPYFNMLISAHDWPCGRGHQTVTGSNRYKCLDQQRHKIINIAAELKKDQRLVVNETKLFTIFRLKN